MELHFNYIPEKSRAVSLGEGGLFYRGHRSTYRDAPQETLESITSRVERGTPWRGAVKDFFERDHNWLYRIITHPDRALFFRLYPPAHDANVLDVGSGWGQIALPLAANGCRVCALEPTRERLEFIRAASKQEGLSNKMFFIGCDYLDAEFRQSFDMITCIGAFEWSGKFSSDEDPQNAQRSFLRKVKSELRPDGYCVIGIENRFGLKYWLGAAGDHTGAPGVEILDAALAQKRWKKKNGAELRTFIYTMGEYQDLLADAGFREINFYAAFPDYKLPQVIIPLDKASLLAEFLQKGKAVPEHDGSNGNMLSEEIQENLRSHYASLAGMGIAQYFVPSYFITAR